MSQYPHLYGSKAWQQIKANQLQKEPLCRICKAIGLITEARIVDHVAPHRGNPEKFFAGPFQSLCKQCHDSAKQTEEKRGHSKIVGVDGWPVDDRHPINRK